MTSQAFSSREIGVATTLAFLLQGAFFTLLAFYGSTRAISKKEVIELPKEIPIEVMPVIDELPLLKLGTKNPVKPRLPEMWQKRAPRPVKRYEERSAPSDQALDDPDEIPESELADKQHKAPPEDAEIVKKVEQELEDDDEPKEESPLTEEGAEDGSKDGTETDPLKARQVDLYKIKIASWFNARFSPPTDAIPCEVLRTLSAGVTVQVGDGRRIASFSIASPSGNGVFDAKVNSTMQALVGQQLPPPPPLYPDILGTSVFPRLSGAGVSCPD